VILEVLEFLAVLNQTFVRPVIAEREVKCSRLLHPVYLYTTEHLELFFFLAKKTCSKQALKKKKSFAAHESFNAELLPVLVTRIHCLIHMVHCLQIVFVTVSIK